MNAQEIFEELGYTQSTRMRAGKRIMSYKDKHDRRITFCINDQNFISTHYVDVDPFKPIHQQMKELGWIE